MVAGGIIAARAARDAVLGAKAKGERIAPNPRLRFGEAADRWLTEQVSDLRANTQLSAANSVNTHLRPRWGKRRLDHITVNDAAALVRELRAEGKAETTIATVLRAAARIFVFARRRCGYHGANPVAELETSEPAHTSRTAAPRIYEGDELAQVLEASTEPWRTLFALAATCGARCSELLGLHWSDLELEHLEAATVTFTHQVSRAGERSELKTAETKATLPLPRSTAAMLLEHKARAAHSGAQAFVFASSSGRALGQRNASRALHKAQERARRADGTPTFPALFEADEHGHLRVDERGRYVRRRQGRHELEPLPDFHALRHTAAMACDDAEEARDLLRHKTSNVTRAVYRGHFDDRRREQLRTRLEARSAGSAVEATERSTTQSEAVAEAEILELRRRAQP